MKTLELIVTENGNIQSMYDDSLQELVDELGEFGLIKRASNIEWEEPYSNYPGGWVIRSARFKDIAVRKTKDGELLVEGGGKGYLLVTFSSREEALKVERKFFWQLYRGY